MITVDQAMDVKELRSGVKPVWCRGCGHFGIMTALLKAIAQLKLDPTHVVIASGIGCSSRLPAYVNAYGFHGVHGRALPLATGIKVANPKLTVFAVAGDGDAFSIGGGHLPHAVRRNVDITYIVMDNDIYGMTKGQPSPTSRYGLEKKAAPYGTIDTPLNPIAMLLGYGATFVARGFSSKPKELTEIIKRAALHSGFSFVQVLSPCVTYNNNLAYYKETTVPLPSDHNVADRSAAMALAFRKDKNHLGVFFEEAQATYHERLLQVQEKSGGQFSLEEVIERFRR